jgi:hypothetical protein
MDFMEICVKIKNVPMIVLEMELVQMVHVFVIQHGKEKIVH